MILAIKRGDDINIEYSKQEIINKINSYFGYKLISEIRLQASNKIQKKERKKISLNKSTNKLKSKIDEKATAEEEFSKGLRDLDESPDQHLSKMEA